jgi:DNA-binding winged helix-turn-helix (wHTH) protein
LQHQRDWPANCQSKAALRREDFENDRIVMENIMEKCVVPTDAPTIWFGPYQLDVAERRLLHGDAAIPLQPRVFDLLAYLATHPGKLVSKQTLLDDVWSGAVVTENSLTQAIRALRASLGDDADRPRYIETVRRSGYRFIGAVQTSAPPPIDTAVELSADAGVDAQLPALLAPYLPQSADGRQRVLFVRGSAAHGDSTLLAGYESLFRAFLQTLSANTRVTLAVIEEPASSDDASAEPMRPPPISRRPVVVRINERRYSHTDERRTSVSDDARAARASPPV